MSVVHVCPSCHSPGPARLILDETRGNYTCDDPWHSDPDGLAHLPIEERIAARARGIAEMAESLAGVRIDQASLPPDSDPDRNAQ